MLKDNDKDQTFKRKNKDKYYTYRDKEIKVIIDLQRPTRTYKDQ